MIAHSAENTIDIIHEMGYIMVKPKDVIKPSFYKLKDGTFMNALVNIGHMIEDPKMPYGYAVSTFTTIATYVPRENRHPDRYMQFDPSSIPSSIVEEDMKYETLVEDFNVYSMSNGMTLSVKSVAAQVSKTRLYTIQGEPLYLASVSPVIKITNTK